MQHSSGSYLTTLLLLCNFVLFTHQNIHDVNTEHLHSWKFVDFAYPSEHSRTIAKQQGLYNPEHVVILDSDYYFSPQTSIKRIFVTTPQFRTGIPATVSEVTKDTNKDGDYLIKPFPSWDAVGGASCEFAVSAYRILIDKSGLLWILDTGRVETFVNPRRVCRPKVLIYDIKNGDTLIERYEFPDGVINDRSNLITLITESYQEDSRDSVAYIADVNGYSLVVFDLPSRTSWRVDHRYFYPFPMHAVMTVSGITFELMDGIFGLALGPGRQHERKLYFHSLASLRESWVPTSVLRNSTLVQQQHFMRDKIGLSEEARPGQSTLEVMTDDGILLFALLTKNAIACWNSATPFMKQNIHIIYEDHDRLQFISGMKLKHPSNNLLITTSRLQNYINGNLKYEDVKYRLVLLDNVKTLLKDTPCKQPKYGANKGTSASEKNGYGQSSSSGQKPPVWSSGSSY